MDKKRRVWVWALVAVCVLVVILVIAWAMGKKILENTSKIDTWAEGLGTLGTVGGGIDALGEFWGWFKGLFGGKKT